MGNLERAGSTLAPGQLDSYEFEIGYCPHDVEKPVISQFGVIGTLNETLVVTPWISASRAKVTVTNTSEESFKAIIDLVGQQPLHIPISEEMRPVEAVRIQTSDGELAWNQGPEQTNAQVPFELHFTELNMSELGYSELNSLLNNIYFRSAALTELAARYVHDGKFEMAIRVIEEALLYAGDDPLTWWRRAALHRHTAPNSENPYWLNAFAISPMEPCLRAEQLLSQGGTSTELNPLLAPLVGSPRALIEPAAKLIHFRLYTDALGYIDSAVKHSPINTLFYMYGAVLFTTTNMKATAMDYFEMGRSASLQLSAEGPEQHWAHQIAKEALGFKV
jgi:tetratricopeptide (TPR) repeat protein